MLEAKPRRTGAKARSSGGQLEPVSAASHTKTATPQIGRPSITFGALAEHSVSAKGGGLYSLLQVFQVGNLESFLEFFQSIPADFSIVLDSETLEDAGGGPGAVTSLDSLTGGEGRKFHGGLGEGTAEERRMKEVYTLRGHL